MFKTIEKKVKHIAGNGIWFSMDSSGKIRLMEGSNGFRCKNALAQIADIRKKSPERFTGDHMYILTVEKIELTKVYYKINRII